MTGCIPTVSNSTVTRLNVYGVRLVAANIVYQQYGRSSILLPSSLPRRPATCVSLSTRTCRWRLTSSELSRASSARYDSCALSGDRYRPLSSSHWLSRWSSAGLTTATVCWLGTCQLDPASSAGSKSCSTADFDIRSSEHITDALASLTGVAFHDPCKAHPLLRTHLPRSE